MCFIFLEFRRILLNIVWCWCWSVWNKKLPVFPLALTFNPSKFLNEYKNIISRDMSKNVKGFLNDINMDYDTYKQIAGISTRARMPVNKQSPPSEKPEEKKKPSKKDTYVPPQCF